MISQSTASNRVISSMHASTSVVSQVNIDWISIGSVPPILMDPIETVLVCRLTGSTLGFLFLVWF
ncbi:uncharacterized protein METZ01_LOCUS310180 [marine metagenome]|uniref:Uncharacterized protein n=1 Tax=marine metagenome TaxID=408172 RepID=A0A382N8C7_9ZZZZ